MRPAHLVTTLVLAVAPVLARGHETGISYGELTVRGDRVEASLRLSAAELMATAATATAPASPEIAAATLASFAIAQGGVACAFEPGDARPEPPDGVRVTGAFQCQRAGEPLRVSAGGLLARMSWGHTHLAKVIVGDRVEEHVVRAGRDSFEVEAPPSWWAQAARFLRLGVEHIFTGYDHIAFVLGLLLLGGTLRQVVGVVTSFTLAHSVTLAVASLGLFRVPPQIVEPLIAASIVCIAIENLLQLRRPTRSPPPARPEQSLPPARPERSRRAPDRGRVRRWRIGFAFGLVHGFGFAGALTELHLSTSGLATALLSFNAGVELGQAAIVAAAFPLLTLLRRWPARAPLFLRTGSLAIGAAGAFWLVERLPWMRFA